MAAAEIAPGLRAGGMEAVDTGAPVYTSEMTDTGAGPVVVGWGSSSDLSNEDETDAEAFSGFAIAADAIGVSDTSEIAGCGAGR